MTYLDMVGFCDGPSFHSMLETIFWARDLSNLLQVWENADLKLWALALR